MAWINMMVSRHMKKTYNFSASTPCAGQNHPLLSPSSIPFRIQTTQKSSSLFLHQVINANSSSISQNQHILPILEPQAFLLLKVMTSSQHCLTVFKQLFMTNVTEVLFILLGLILIKQHLNKTRKKKTCMLRKESEASVKY